MLGNDRGGAVVPLLGVASGASFGGTVPRGGGVLSLCWRPQTSLAAVLSQRPTFLLNCQYVHDNYRATSSSPACDSPEAAAAHQHGVRLL
jgi:hypothetical protein